MKERFEKLTMALSDAGLGQDAIDQAERLLQAGCTEDLIRYLRLCRCDLMEDLHRSQRRVDHLDYVIRRTEKTLAAK